MYYELIRMLVNYEKEQCRDQELYEYTRSISKIEGYQVSNKIQKAFLYIVKSLIFSGSYQ